MEDNSQTYSLLAQPVSFVSITSVNETESKRNAESDNENEVFRIQKY